MDIFRKADGSPVELGEVLSRGGEGIIHDVPALPHFVAKIWREPNERQARKLGILLGHPPALPDDAWQRVEMAWPTEALYDDENVMRGYLMPRVPVNQYHELVRFCIPAARRTLESSRGAPFSRLEMLAIARNLCETFRLLHESGYVVGDVNHTNFLVRTDGKVFVIDLDSVQTTDPETGEVQRCTVGKEDFTPPRLMGLRFEDVDRTPDDDLFGLAVLVFQILMNGSHPYDPVDQSGGQGQVRQENIRQGNSPYVNLDVIQARAVLDLENIPDQAIREQQRRNILALIGLGATADFDTVLGPRMSSWLELEPAFREMFAQAFGSERNERPASPEWIGAIDGVRASLQPAAPAPPAVPAPPTAPAGRPPAAPASQPAAQPVPQPAPAAASPFIRPAAPMASPSSYANPPLANRPPQPAAAGAGPPAAPAGQYFASASGGGSGRWKFFVGIPVSVAIVVVIAILLLPGGDSGTADAAVPYEPPTVTAVPTAVPLAATEAPAVMAEPTAAPRVRRMPTPTFPITQAPPTATLEPTPTPTPNPVPERVTAESGLLSAGYLHSCRVGRDGSLACWGSNTDFEGEIEFGQARPPSGEFVSVSAGVYHTCGVRSNGTLACWGSNTDFEGEIEFGQARPPSGEFVSVSAGAIHTCGVRRNGTLACWGSNTDFGREDVGQARPPSGEFVSVSAGGYHTCGVRRNGTLACWGSNTDLGGEDVGQARPPSGEFVSVSTGVYHTCGVRRNGTLACWGSNENPGGQDIGQARPPSGEFVSVSAGSRHTCGLRSDGQIKCWGTNDRGRSTPPSGEFLSVSAGYHHTCGQRQGGSVECWGWNDYDQATPSRAVSASTLRPTPTYTPTPRPTRRPTPVRVPHLGYIPLLDAEVTLLYFTERDADFIDSDNPERIVSTTVFSNLPDRYFYWVVHLESPPAKATTDFDIHATYYGPDEKIVAQKTYGAVIKPGLERFAYYDSMPRGRGGIWTPGAYWLELTVGGQVVASGGFEIADRVVRRPTISPTPTRRPTPTPTPRRIRRPTPTPSPTATPAPSWVWRVLQNKSYDYTFQYEQNWALTDGASARGRPFLDVTVKDFNSGESVASFFERHRQELLAQASNYAAFEPGLTRGETVNNRNYIHMEYLWQPGSNDCLYHVVEHIFRSRFYPVRDYGFIVTAGVCEDQLTRYDRVRTNILSSFEETE